MSTMKVTAKINIENIDKVLEHLRNTDDEGDIICLMHPIIKGPQQALTSNDLHLWLTTLRRLLIEKSSTVKEGEAL